MFSTKTKNWFAKASAIWLLVAGAGLTVLGLLYLVSFFRSCGINEHGIHEQDTIALMFSSVIIPGLLFLFAGMLVLQRTARWFAFICLVFLFAGFLWWGLNYGLWLIAAAVMLFTATAGAGLVISKDSFY